MSDANQAGLLCLIGIHLALSCLAMLFFLYRGGMFPYDLPHGPHDKNPTLVSLACFLFLILVVWPYTYARAYMNMKKRTAAFKR